MNSTRAILLVIGLWLNTVPGYPTLVVAIKTPEGYVIGTDSLRSHVSGSASTVCKIRVAHDTALLDWGALGQADDNRRGWIGLTQPFLMDPAGSAQERREKLIAQMKTFTEFNKAISRMHDMVVGGAFVGHDGFYGFTSELSDRASPQGGYRTERFDNPPYQAFGVNEDKARKALQDRAGMLQTPLVQAFELAKQTLEDGMRRTPNSVHSPFTIILVPNGKGKIMEHEDGACK